MGYWWESGVRFDAVELDDDPDQAAEDVAAGLDLTVQGAPVLRLYGSSEFPCADDAECDAEQLALAHEVVRRFNAFPALLAACKGLLAVIHDSDRRPHPSAVRSLSIVSGQPECAAVDAARAAVASAEGTP